ncbi:hypothetical protein M758_12G038000 [Ceratodon purpureus]|uniref:Acireductone dioxygenase n=1 Tax=Ceratodon purpureus TaxID=3225 RepID=A0A8T0G7A6_CERPU|nr:hypothetical protein KC19_12G037300 [Ceratodon purpureus]KAG0598017.1 hypothetical protein M758_12G038000 [Ceratodon purpureus]
MELVPLQAKNMPIEAWYYNPNSVEDPEEKDPTLPHHFNPDQQVPQEHLETLGVLVWTELQTKDYKKNQQFQQVKIERGYNYEEVVTVAPNRLANYEQKKREFFKEHLHEHEEIRLILEGSGYEDIRDFDGHWIRIHIRKGVLIVLPKGMYHRFTVDDTNYLKAVLLYQETPSRIQFDRSNAGTDIMEVREHYVTHVLSRGASLKGNSSDLSGMLEGLDDELEKFRANQEIVEATLDESNLYADALKVAQAAKSSADDDVATRLALVAQTLQAVPPAKAEDSNDKEAVDTRMTQLGHAMSL